MRTLAIKALVVSLFLTVLAGAQDVVGLRKLLALWPADGQASVELLDEVFHEIVTIDPGGHSEFISQGLLTELKRAGVPEAAALKALDARRYQRVEEVLKQLIIELEKDGVWIEAAIRTGSSGLRHLEIANAGGDLSSKIASAYRYFRSDDDITFIGKGAEEAQKRFNTLLREQGLDALKVKGFDLKTLNEARGLDLAALNLLDREKFVGEAALRGIQAEMLGKGAVIAARLPGSDQAVKASEAVKRGKALHEQKKYSEAVKEFDEAVKLDPNNAESYRLRARSKRAAGDLNGALSDYDKTLLIDPKNKFAHYGRGIMYQNEGKFDLAIAAYSKAIAIDPQYTAAINNRGVTYSSQKKHESAIADYTKAIAVDPQYANAYKNRGICYEYQGRYDLAVADYAKAIAINPNDEEAKKYLAEVRPKLAATKAEKPTNPPANDQPGRPHSVDTAAVAKKTRAADQISSGPTERGKKSDDAPARSDDATIPVMLDTPSGLPPEPAESVRLDKQQSAALENPCDKLNLTEEAEDQGEEPGLSGITDLARLQAALDREADTSFRETAAVPSELQGSLSRSLDQLTRRRFTETVNAAMEGLRLLRGPLAADQEKQFQELWAPLLDFPSRSTVAYLERLNPLLAEFLSLQQATEAAVASQEEARYELEMAAAYESEAGAREVLGLLAQNTAELRSLKDRINQVMTAVQALGDPPNPQEDKCRARRRTKKALAQPGAGGGAWVRGKKLTQVTWRRESALPLKFEKNDVAFSANTAEVFSRVPGSYLTNNPKEQWPDLVNRWRAVWAEPPAVLAGGDKVRMNTYIEDTGCTYFDQPYVKIWLRSAQHIADAVLWDGMIREWKPERKLNDEYRTLVVEACGAGGNKRQTPYEADEYERKRFSTSFQPQWKPFSVNMKGWWPLELKPGQPGWTMTMEVQIHSNYIDAIACYEYTWDPAASPPPPGQEARLVLPERLAGKITDSMTGKPIGAPAAAGAAATSPPAASPEARLSLKEKTDFHRGNVRMLEGDRQRLEQLIAGAADESSRLSLQYQMTCKLADIQAEKDAVDSLETGTFIRTRTAWDEMVSLQMQAQSREDAAKIADNNYRRGALERLTNLLPPEERDATRRWARQQLGSGEPDPEKLRKVGSVISGKVQALNLAAGARQDEKAAEATLVTDVLENYQTAARYTMYATPYVAGGPALAMVYGLAQGSVAGYQTGGLLGEGYQGATGAVVGGVVTAARYLVPTIDYGITFAEGAMASDVEGQRSGLLGGLEAVAWTMTERQIIGRATTRIQALQQRFTQVRRQARLDSWRDAKRRADFTQEREYGKGLVVEHQRRYQEFKELKRSGAPPAQLQAAEARLIDQTSAIMHAPHAKGYLKFNASRAEQAAYASTSRLQTQRVVKAFREDLERQGVRVEDLDFRPIRNAGNTSPGMDLDLAAASRYGTRVPTFDPRTNKPLNDAQGQPVTRLIQKVRVADPKSGQTAELDMYSANKLMQGSFNRVYAQLSGKRSAEASWQMVTSGKHLEAYADMKWLKVRQMREAGIDPLAAIDPRYAADAALVTQVKSDHMENPGAARPAGLDNQNWERYRGMAKDIRTKALELLRAKHDDPKTSPATKKEIRGKYKFYYRLAKAMDKANHDPVAADEAVRRLTGFDAPDVISMTSIGIEALGKWK